jgi:sodium transport system permease protein
MASPASQSGTNGGSKRTTKGRVVRVVLINELRRLLRDRKALMLALVLPMALYPLLFWGSRELGRVGQEQLASEAVRTLIDLSPLAEDLRSEILNSLNQPEARIELVPVDFPRARGPAERAEAAAQLLAGSADAQSTTAAQVVVVGNAGGLGPKLLIYYRGTNERSLEAASRIEERLELVAKARLASGLEAAIGEDPVASLKAVEVDLAPARDRAGASLGRLLPLILTLLLISGGAFAALDAFAAERELGTLETLLVQPVHSYLIALGKFLAVLVTSLVTWAGNAASLLLCAGLGLFDPGNLSGAGTATQGLEGYDAALLGRIALGSLLFLPTAALLAAVLCLISARARSFREGQQLLMPLSLTAVALTAPASLPTLELNWSLACLPLLGPALAMRDALVGQLEAGLALLTLIASLLPLGLALGSIGRTLDAERLLKEERPKGDLALWDRLGRFGLRTTSALAIGMWLVGGSWVSQHGLSGRLMGLAVALGFGLWLARHQAKASNSRLVEQVGMEPLLLRAWLWPLVGGLLLALCHAPLMAWSERLPSASLYPAADSLKHALGAQQPLLRLLLGSLLPALALEFAFRGALPKALWRAQQGSRRLVHACVFPALLFTLAEGALMGWLPALALGLVAGWVRLGPLGLPGAVVVHLIARAAAIAAVVPANWQALPGGSTGPLAAALVVVAVCLPAYAGTRSHSGG